MKHIPDLDGLRGVAAVGIVAFHWAPTYIFWAWAFVPLFFVLSGFLMGRILLGDLLANRLSLRNFYIRRALRIWPVYYAALLAILAYYLLRWGSAFFATPYFGDWLISLAFLQFTPLYVGHIDDPWSIFNFMPGMQHLWSLAIEEQFYLLLPVMLIILLPRLGLRGMGWLCLCLAVVGPLMRAIGLPPALLGTQTDGLALGVLLAVITIPRPGAPPAAQHRKWVVAFAAAVIIALLGALPYLILGYRHTPGPAELFADPLLWFEAALLSFGLIGLILSFPGNRVSAFLRSAPFVYAGSVSYALYVFHLPLLTFIKPKIFKLCGPQLEWLAVALTIALLWALVHASREFIERPVLRLKTRLTPQQTENAS